MTKVAIITRTKDRPIFLKRALDSIANQTFTEYELLIVNDGGDESPVDDLVSQQSEQFRQKITVYHRPLSSNAPDTIFNESIDKTAGEYFAIHDDDDTWHPDFLQKTVEFLDENTDRAAVVVRADKIIEQVKGAIITTVKRQTYMPDMLAISLYRQCLDNQLTPIATLFRRSAYEQAGKFDNSLPVVGDWEFGIRLLSKFDVGFIDPGYPLAGYHHRKSRDNSFAKHNHRKYITLVFNKYLRADLESGKFGVGYIMNDLRYQQDFVTSTVRKLVPNAAAKLIRKKVRD